VEFDRAPFGILGFETAVGLALELVHKGKISLLRMVELFTTGPAQSAGGGAKVWRRRDGGLDDIFCGL